MANIIAVLIFIACVSVQVNSQWPYSKYSSAAYPEFSVSSIVDRINELNAQRKVGIVGSSAPHSATTAIPVETASKSTVASDSEDNSGESESSDKSSSDESSEESVEDDSSSSSDSSSDEETTTKKSSEKVEKKEEVTKKTKTHTKKVKAKEQSTTESPDDKIADIVSEVLKQIMDSLPKTPVASPPAQNAAVPPQQPPWMMWSNFGGGNKGWSGNGGSYGNGGGQYYGPWASGNGESGSSTPAPGSLWDFINQKIAEQSEDSANVPGLEVIDEATALSVYPTKAKQADGKNKN